MDDKIYVPNWGCDNVFVYVEILPLCGTPVSKNKEKRGIYFRTRLLRFAFVLFYLQKVTILFYSRLLIIFLSNMKKLSKIEVPIPSNCIVKV